MQTLNVDIDENQLETWNHLPENLRSVMVSRVLNALLSGQAYPSGPEKLDFAIELAESGVDTETISKLTHLEIEVFQDFLSN